MYRKVSVEFHLRESSRLERNEGSLFIRIIYNRQINSVTTPYKLFSDEWDKKNKLIIFPSDDKHRFSYLKKIEKSMQEDIHFFANIISYWEEKGDFTAFDIASAYRRLKDGNKLSSYVYRLSKELNANKQERTARGYVSTLDAIIRFTKNTNLTFEQLTPRIIKQFENDMRIKGKTLNTISFYMRNLRAIYNKAIKDGVAQPKLINPFEQVYTGVQVTKKRALTKEQMKKIVECQPREKELLFAQSLFLFSFYLRGMAFVDMAFLKKTDLRDGVISYKRKKTSQLLEIKVTPAVQQILDRYKEETRNSSYLLPIILPGYGPDRLQYESALRVQNKRLKEFAKRCGIKSNLSTHVARHSWATLAKEANLPLPVISEGLGHSSQKTTAIYLASFDRSVLDYANEEVMQMLK